MNPIKLLALTIGAMLFVAANVSPAGAVDLAVGTRSGVETITVPITVSDPAGIAGAAFTIEYDSTELNILGVSSTFFDTFANQFSGTSASSLTSVEVDGLTYTQPLISNSVTGTGMRIAAARCVAAESNSSSTLFYLSVALQDGASIGTYPINIIQTTLNNTDAGYAAEGEAIPYLIGADANETNLSLAFPEITVDQITPGDITFLEGLLGDVNDDGSIDISDVLDIIDIIFQIKSPTALEFATANVDDTNDTIDITDLLGVIDKIFGN